MKIASPFVRSRRWWLTGCLVGGASIVLPAHVGFAQRFEYVITFDNVAVRGVDPIDSPEAAHREIPGLDNVSVSVERRSEGVDSRAGAKGAPGSAQLPADSNRGITRSSPLPKVTVRVGPRLSFEPGDGRDNPSF